ncbi:hypothetical protein OC835_003432 [Tilletia horrida]|nr:hypothetical protein OC835_003432 [Tilletia horrida]
MADNTAAPSPPRALQVPEILRDIFTYHAREQVDLVQLSTVNKQFRSVALPLLVRHLEVPLSRAHQYALLFEANPTLCRFVRSVRLFDDEAELRHRAREHSKPRFLPEPQSRQSEYTAFRSRANQQTRENTDDRWLNAEDLVNALWDDSPKQFPPFDITFGIRSVFSVHRFLIDCFPEVGFIAALRVLADHDQRPQIAAHHDDWSAYQHHCNERWSKLKDTLRDLSAMRGLDESSLLPLLQIEDWSEPNVNNLEQIGMELWETATAAIGPKAETFNVHIDSGMLYGAELEAILDGHWPHLRSFKLQSLVEGEGMMGIEDDMDVDQFLKRHSQLEEIYIDAPAFYVSTELDHDFPKLTKLYISRADSEKLADFIDRHAETLVDLGVPVNFDVRHIVTRLRPKFPKLRILRASNRVISSLVSSGLAPALTHLEFEPVPMLASNLLFWASQANAAKRITCLDLEIVDEDIHEVATQLGKQLEARHYTQLAELSICCTKASRDEALQSERGASEMLAYVFRHLKSATALRALRIERTISRPFSPATQLLSFPNSEIPPSLQYLSWHSPDFNKTQYFRVVPVQDGTPAGSPELSCLQLLPARFRANVTSRGEWVQPPNLRHANVLFDHTRSPPELV